MSLLEFDCVIISELLIRITLEEIEKLSCNREMKDMIDKITENNYFWRMKCQNNFGFSDSVTRDWKKIYEFCEESSGDQPEKLMYQTLKTKKYSLCEIILEGGYRPKHQDLEVCLETEYIEGLSLILNKIDINLEIYNYYLHRYSRMSLKILRLLAKKFKIREMWFYGDVIVKFRRSGNRAGAEYLRNLCNEYLKF